MKTLALVVLSVIFSAAASPLGDRVVFRRHKGVPLSRRFILQSRMDTPPACIVPTASGTATAPSGSVTSLPPLDTGATDNSTDTSDLTGGSNSTLADPSDANATLVDPTATGNSTAAANTTATRRFWERRGFGFHGFTDTISEHSSVSVSFEETVSSFVETWENLCIVSGGDIVTNDPCTLLAGYYGIDSLLETADPCDQQIIADNMITFAKSHGIRNRDALINFAISFRRHPRHSVEILDVLPSSLYCLETPINPELVGVYNDQIDGVNPGLFGSPSAPIVPFGSSGTCPLGMTADVSTCSCLGSDGSADITDGSDADSTDSTDSTDDSDDSTDTSTSTDATSTDTADASTATDATSTDTADASTATDATSTDTADASTATDATSTDTADASASTNATATDSTASAVVTPPPSNPTDINVQPTDISGNVNDPAGRR